MYLLRITLPLYPKPTLTKKLGLIQKIYIYIEILKVITTVFSTTYLG